MSDFLTSLTKRWRSSRSLLCVGLDPDRTRFPRKNLSLFEFSREIIDATAPFACAFKPQVAHYAALGGENELAQTIDYIKEHHADIPVILDAKRGDIGSTAEMCAREVFVRYNADAVTLNPYLGFDALEPFFRNKDKGIFVLCRTSNPGSGEFQELQTESGFTLACQVASKAQFMQRKHRNIGLVVGATWPSAIEAVRNLAGTMPLLIPGVGAQGGDLRGALAKGLNKAGDGVLINVSRAILYASSGDDFAEAAARAAERFFNDINAFRQPVVSTSRSRQKKQVQLGFEVGKIPGDAIAEPATLRPRAPARRKGSKALYSWQKQHTYLLFDVTKKPSDAIAEPVTAGPRKSAQRKRSAQSA